MRVFVIWCIAIVLINPSVFADEPTITVVGSATATVVPDHIKILADCDAQAETAASAMQKVGSKTSNILQYLANSGLKNQDIYVSPTIVTSQSVTALQPSKGGNDRQRNRAVQGRDPFSDSNQDPFGPDPETLTTQAVEYQARKTICITLRESIKTDEICQGLFVNGIERIRQIEPQSTNLKQHHENVSVSAVRVARAKAEALAREMGVSLGSVKSISETEDSGSDNPFGVGLCLLHRIRKAS